MTEIRMTNKETAIHFRKWVETGHGPFAWPSDGCGYIQSVRFAQYRNEQWEKSSLDAKAFLIEYANKIENEPDTFCLCLHPNVSVGYSCYCCRELSCKFAGYKRDGTIFDLGVRGSNQQEQPAGDGQ